MKPGGLQLQSHPQGTRTPDRPAQPTKIHEPPTPGSQQAPITHKPNGSVEKKNNYIYILYIYTTNTLQPHGTTTHVLTQNITGQSQPHGSNDHMTAANTTRCTKHQTTKQTLTDSQDTNNHLQNTPLTRLAPSC